jgi:FtsP/CotA-like multicopper oxidase with cupredoxin domain
MRVESGKRVKLRLVNANQLSEKYMLQGTAYQITDIDGSPIRNPDLLPDRTAFRLAAGGRYDVVFTMPDRPVLFMMGDDTNSDQPGVIFYTNSPPEQPDLQADSGQFDPSRYGQPAENEVTAVKTFDREFTMIMGNKMGFYDGNFTFLWTINGEVYPHTPTFVVKEGERVKTTFINKSFSEHPMHLHGHHMTVLKKNGKNVKTPWVTDTLNVNPDETYEVAFTADNPGMWMDHCHLLDHAAVGMVLHLMYDNVMPSYKVGAGTGNQPE